MESKNFYHAKGALAEALVYSYFINRNYIFVSHRKKINKIEIDLIFYHKIKKQYLLIEVKSVAHFESLDVRVSKSQIHRLKKAILYCKNNLKNIEKTQSFLQVNGYIIYVEVLKNKFIYHRLEDINV